MASRKSTNNVISIAIIAIVLLLGTVGYLWVQNNNLKKQLTKYDNEIKVFTQTQAKLEKDYNLAISSLDELKGDNLELNKLIEDQKAELTVQKNKISSLIWKSKKLKEAKKEIVNLKNQALAYIQEIQNLKEQNVVLTSANQRLQRDKSELSQKLNISSTQLAKKENENDSLLTIKQKLEKDKKKLLYKTNKASVIKVNDLSVKGYVLKSNGKYSRRRKAKNIQLLKICFTMDKNEIADIGEEVFYVRLIAPDGNTVYEEKAGSGILTKSIDGTKMKYTKRYNVDYSGQNEDICLILNKDFPLKKGRYQIEVYNKGYLAGADNFKLR